MGAIIATEDGCRIALARCLCHVPMLCETDNKCFIKRLLLRSAPSRVEMIFVYRVHHNIATLQQQQQKYELLLQENTMDNIGQWTFPNTQLRHTNTHTGRLHTVRYKCSQGSGNFAQIDNAMNEYADFRDTLASVQADTRLVHYARGSYPIHINNSRK